MIFGDDKMIILIDGNLIPDKSTLFQELKKQINSQEFYGDNLDALADVLFATNEKIEIKVLHTKILFEHLDNYAQALIKLLEDVSTKKSNITLEKK